MRQRDTNRARPGAPAVRAERWHERYPVSAREIALGLVILVLALLAGCQSAAPPADVDGKLAQDVMMETYVAVLEGRDDYPKS